LDTGQSNEKQDLGLRNVVLATNASDTMDCEEVKHINTGRNQGGDVTSSEGIKTQADVFW